MRDEEPTFSTAAELRDATPEFDIRQRPRRRYPRSGGLKYEGETVFTLTPTAEPTGDGEPADGGEPTGDGEPADGSELADDDEPSDEVLVALVESVLGDEPYTYGDWFDLPMPLFSVHDHGTGDTFRVAVREGTVEFHVLPETDAAGLSALYDRLDAASDCSWRVDSRIG